MSVSKLIELFAIKLQEDLQSTLKAKLLSKSKNGFSGDSRLAASIRISYYENGGDIFGFDLLMNDYYKWVNKGRAAGKGISREGQVKLEKWIKSRGLKPALTDNRKKKISSVRNKRIKKSFKKLSEDKAIKKVVFAISKKIKEKGYEANHFFDEVIKDGRVEKLKARMKEAYKQELELEILEITK